MTPIFRISGYRMRYGIPILPNRTRCWGDITSHKGKCGCDKRRKVDRCCSRGALYKKSHFQHFCTKSLVPALLLFKILECTIKPCYVFGRSSNGEAFQWVSF